MMVKYEGAVFFVTVQGEMRPSLDDGKDKWHHTATRVDKLGFAQETHSFNRRDECSCGQHGCVGVKAARYGRRVV